MSKNTFYEGGWVAPNSKLYELLEIAAKTNKPEDRKAAAAHHREVHLLFLKQAGLPHTCECKPWCIGQLKEAL